jgi:hypothetical protein
MASRQWSYLQFLSGIVCLNRSVSLAGDVSTSEIPVDLSPIYFGLIIVLLLTYDVVDNICENTSFYLVGFDLYRYIYYFNISSTFCSKAT